MYLKKKQMEAWRRIQQKKIPNYLLKSHWILCPMINLFRDGLRECNLMAQVNFVSPFIFYFDNYVLMTNESISRGKYGAIIQGK